MSTLSGIEKWTEEHHPLWIDFIRIILGIFLIAKGAFLVTHRKQVEWLLVTHHLDFLLAMASTYIIMLYLGGGILIATGLITRWAAGFQIPALIGAVFFANIPRKIAGIDIGPGYSIVILALLIFFLIYGSGSLSLDHYLQTHEDR